MMDSLEDRVDRALAYEEIRQLAYRYSISVDSRDIDTLVGLYVEGALFAGQPFTRDQIRARFSEMLAKNPMMILNVGNHLIDFDDPDHAHGTVYARCEVEAGPQTWLVQQIVYLDQYVRHAGKWYFFKREHLLFYGCDLLTRPIGLHQAAQPENTDGKGSMPQRWPTYRAFYERHPDAAHY
jgi:hypothetical protein